MKHRIFILEDHPVMRRGYRVLINGEMDLEVCGEAETATEALEAISSAAPDVVIADISLDGMNGIEFIKCLHARHPGMDVLVVSMHDESLYAERALHAGAAGYLMKTEAESRVIPAIRRVIGGRYAVSERIEDQIMVQFAGRIPVKEAARLPNPLSQLSDRELEVFELHGRGMSTREMAEALGISAKTVATHRGRMKNKLAIESTPELIRRAVLWMQNEVREPADVP
ncbi:MAG: DNA-binding response regulator [Bacteroidetes bacterium CG12_big_fil_rev_8_21_14_0_65_60_17]|nr:MAG: DNA-binding response regulator [Bacteroidetes bacterium CG12_big_fil_rev_8_21_14_0_65_60_17]